MWSCGFYLSLITHRTVKTKFPFSKWANALGIKIACMCDLPTLPSHEY